jgi:L-2-hydroxyglutarate oxidase LhgO
MQKTEIAIIGAGVIGLAIAYELSKKRKDIVVVEKEPTFGQETSSRNSEVIHAGIYYPKDFLKTRLCVEGRELLYEFCQRYNIAHKKIGKLIVANGKSEIEEIKELVELASDKGVKDLKLLMSAADIEKIEPHIKADSALYSPSTGIIDTHHFMKCLEFLSEEKKTIFAYNYEVTGIEKAGQGYKLQLEGADGEKAVLFTRIFINSAGLYADKIAQMAGIDIDDCKYRLFYCKGEYFRLRGDIKGMVNHLIYPPPRADSLGIHIVIDLNQEVKLGPNTFYVNSLEYDVEPDHVKDFYNTAKRYMPFLKEDDLSPDNSGIRPKLQAPGEPMRDFIISHEKQKGLEGIINLIGIESPGLTASLAIAKYVSDMI